MRELEKFIKNRLEYKAFKKSLKRSKRQMRINTLENEIETLTNILCKRDITIKQLEGKLKKANKEIRELKKKGKEAC